MVKPGSPAGAATEDDVGVSLTDDFDGAVRPHLAVMRRLAAVTAVGVDPDDVVQEALLRAWTKRGTYRPGRGSVRTWLLAVTADQGRRLRRRRRRDFALAGRGGGIGADLTSAGSNLDLRRAVNALPRRQRQAVLLFYFVDLSVADTAQLMRCAGGTVKSTLADARTKLALELGDTHE